MELSAAYFVNRKLAVGAEYRTKPNNLRSPINPALQPLTGSSNSVDLKEDDDSDVFVANAPTKHISLTAASVYLGNIATVNAVKADYGKQDAVYFSAQIGF